MAKKEKPQQLPELRIYGISPSLQELLKNIVANLGVDLSSWLKPQLRRIAEEQPDYLKRKPLNY